MHLVFCVWATGWTRKSFQD